MPSMALSVRRLLPALAVALGLAFVVAGAVGLQAAMQSGRDLPSALAVAAPHVGDKWAYDAVLEGPWKMGRNDTQSEGVAFRFAEFEWLPPATMRDSEGRVVMADRLGSSVLEHRLAPDATGRSWVPVNQQHDFGTNAVTSFAHESARPTQGADNSPTFLAQGNLTVKYQDVRTVEGWSRDFIEGPAPCLARTAWQAGSIDIKAGFEATLRSCTPDDLSDASLLHFKAHRRENIAGWQTVRFDADRSTIWQADGLPVPLQIRVESGGRAVTLTLVGFESGQQPLGQGSVAEVDEWAPELVFAKRQLWGPDETGVDHPFPASAAFRTAMSDLQWTELRDWVSSHPTAFAFYLEFRPNNANNRLGWTFALTDGGSDLFAFSATREPEDSLLVVTAPDQFVFERMDWILPIVGPLAPPIQAVPEELPSVGSLWARWASYSTAEGGRDQGNGWGMLLACSSTPCVQADAVVVAGDRPITLMSVANEHPTSRLGLSYTQDGSQVEVNGTRTTAFVRWNETAAYGAAPLTPAPGARGIEGGSVDEGGSGLSAFVPSPATGAAITFAAVVAGLLYYLWPAFKGGALGLFSRLSGPALLEHPTRARLLQLVQSEPGVHFQDLVRRGATSNGSTVHHLRKLEQAGLVAARRLGRYTCYFPGASPNRASLASAPVTRSSGARRILAEVAAHPGLSGQEVASRLGLQPSTVAYHVQRMQEAGLVEGIRDGRLVRLRAIAVP